MKLTEIQNWFGEHLYEMSNFKSTSTGLMNGSVLWVRAEPNVLPHVKFRFKINHPQYGSAVFGFWGDTAEQVAGDWILTGKDLQQVKTFAEKNREALMSHINGDIDTAELVDIFRKNL